jgi:hypothetical protein
MNVHDQPPTTDIDLPKHKREVAFQVQASAASIAASKPAEMSRRSSPSMPLEYLSVSQNTVRNWEASGKIKVRRIDWNGMGIRRASCGPKGVAHAWRHAPSPRLV